MRLTPIFLTLLFLFSPHAYPQENTQSSLPKEALARLGEGKIHKVVYSRDGSRLAAVGTDRIWLYDTKTYEEIAVLTGHTGIVSSVAFSYAKRTLVSGSWDGTVRRWDADTGEFRGMIAKYPAPVKRVVFAPFGYMLAIVVKDKVELWRNGPWELQATLTGHTDEIHSVAVDPGDEVVATGSADNTVRLWDADTGELKRTLARHTEDVTSVAFSRSGLNLVSGSADRTVRLWYVPTGEHKRILDWEGDAVTSVAFRGDDKVIAGGGAWQGKTVRVWNAITGEYSWTLTGTAEHVASVAFSPGEKILATGGGWQENTVRLWDAETGEMKRILTGHVGEVTYLTFSPDAKKLISISDDGAVFVWEITD